MVLVTGASGRLGRRVVAHLLDRLPPAEIAVSARRPNQLADLAALGISVRHGDYDDPESLASAFARVDQLLLVSSSGTPHASRLAHHVAAVTAAKAAGVDHVVYTSLALAAPPSIGVVHRRTELAIVDSGLDYTFLRHPLYTENFLDGVLGETELVSSTGTGRIATAWRDDLAEAAAVVLSGAGHAGRAYALTGSEAWSYDELAAEVSAVTGRTVAHRAVTPAELADLLRAEDVPEPLVGILTDIQYAFAADALADITEDLAGLLGRPPRGMAEAVRALTA